MSFQFIEIILCQFVRLGNVQHESRLYSYSMPFVYIFFLFFPQTILHVGICLPQSCSNQDVNQLVNTMLNSRIFGEKYYLDEQFSIIASKTIKLRDNFFGTTMVNIFLWVFQTAKFKI